MLNPEFTFSPTWWRLSRLGKEPNLIRIAALDFFCDYTANEGKMTVSEALTILGDPVLEALIANETLVVDGENIRIRTGGSASHEYLVRKIIRGIPEQFF